MKALAPLQPFVLATILSLGVIAAWVTATMMLYGVFLSRTLIVDPVKASGACFNSVVVPAPLPFAFVELFFVPAARGTLRWNAGFLRYDFDNMVKASILPFLVIAAISLGLAIWCYVRHRQYSKHGALTWAIFVFLFGAPGFIGYLLHRRWPATEKCANCGTTSPRDRDACLNCNTEFPLPALTGIEIFA